MVFLKYRSRNRLNTRLLDRQLTCTADHYSCYLRRQNYDFGRLTASFENNPKRVFIYHNDEIKIHNNFMLNIGTGLSKDVELEFSLGIKHFFRASVRIHPEKTHNIYELACDIQNPTTIHSRIACIAVTVAFGLTCPSYPSA